MSLTGQNDGMGTTMLVSPAYGGGGFGNGGFGGDWGWIILLLLLAGGGWGNGFGGGFGGFSGGYDFPWLMNGQQGINNNVSSGFRDAQLHDSITSVRDGISSLATQVCNSTGQIQNSLCSGFAGVNATVTNGFADAEIANNARQIANMQQAFNAQVATTQGFNNLGSQLAQCCCDNRLATNDLKYTIATENCADRAALSEGIRDLLTNQTANTQRILDQLCNDKIDAKNEKIADLERQLTMANLQASQIAQTAQIQRGQVEEIDAMYNRLRDCPVPTMPVYGSQPIFTCPNNNNNGCGCGCGQF